MKDLDLQPRDEHGCKHITAQKLLGSELRQCADCDTCLALLLLYYLARFVLALYLVLITPPEHNQYFD